MIYTVYITDVHSHTKSFRSHNQFLGSFLELLHNDSFLFLVLLAIIGGDQTPVCRLHPRLQAHVDATRKRIIEQCLVTVQEVFDPRSNYALLCLVVCLPVLHAYLYAYAGEQWKTAEKVRFIMSDFYTDQPDGIIGNEDCGQMSAWYLLSSMGLYQVNPSDGVFVFGSPCFKKVEVKVRGGNTFTVEAPNNSKENIYHYEDWFLPVLRTLLR